jgi:propanol-preferring alcohol dehydrogenase
MKGIRSFSKLSGLVSSVSRAAVIKKHKADLEIVTQAIKPPAHGEVVVQIQASGLCHTDIHVIDGDWTGAVCQTGMCPGHEGAGIVRAVGPGVTNLKIGDRVGLPWLASACGTCEHCLAGWETLCDTPQFRGFTVAGGMQEYVTAPAMFSSKIPDGLSFVQAAPILCAGVTSYKALKDLNLKPGNFATIVGAGGGLGHLAVQYAAAMGYRAVAVDIPSKKDFCLSLGAEYFVDCTQPDYEAEVVKLTGGGSHGVVTLATQVAAFKSSIKMTRKHGIVSCVALPDGDFGTPIFDVVVKCLSIKGSFVGTRQDLNEALDFAARGKVKCTVVTTSFDNINKAIKTLRTGKVQGRIVINIGGGAECNCENKVGCMCGVCKP